jgi:Ca-activated chloride channel family protein
MMIRTEEFLAAVNYAYPAPTGDRVALHTAAGPSPLGGPQLRLLQVGVRAAEVEVPKRGPAHLIVCVDVSSSMQRGARLEQAQQALRGIVPRLLPEDRVSLVASGSEARVLIEMAGRKHAAELLAAIAALRIEAGSNPVAALRLAYGLAAEDAIVPGRTQQVLLLTDGLIEVDPLATRSLEAYLRTSAARSARLWLVDLSSSQVTPPHWLQLAQASDGRLEQAATADEMRWTLCEALTGKSQKVAAGATLSVWFNPQAVAGYRLFGHEATLLAAKPQADLFAGQTSVGLYELQLLPKGADHVATVTLAWRDAATGQPRTLAQRITRGSFAKSFASEPARLQLATLAAETAELLRRSPYRESGNFRLLRELAGEASKSAVDNASHAELVSLVRQAERARPASTRLRQSWNRGTAK